MQKQRYKNGRYSYLPIPLTGGESLKLLITYLDFLIVKEIDVEKKEAEIVKTLVNNILKNNCKIIVPSECKPLLYRILSNTTEKTGMVVEFAESYNYHMSDYFRQLTEHESKRGKVDDPDTISIYRVRVPSEDVYYSGKAM
jgi:hypothetical protein